MAQSQDYYQILGVDRKASEDEIRRAYRKLARQFHPDVNKQPDAAKRFAEITEAYDVLNDVTKRSEYDRFGRAGVGAGYGSGGGQSGRTRTTWTNVGGPGGPRGAAGGPGSGADFSDIFEQMFSGGGGSPFGGGMGGPGAQARPQRAMRGEDVHHTLSITFITAALGGTEQLRLGGSVNGGKSETIDIKIPPGTEPGAKLRIKGRGRPGHSGGSHGDLILTINVGSHPYFRREGRDLFVDVPINIAEAALGVSVNVPLLKGSVQIKVPAGASSGRKLRVKGQGITDAKGQVGDFYAVIQIVGPEELSEHGRELIEQLQAELINPRESGPFADTA